MNEPPDGRLLVQPRHKAPTRLMATTGSHCPLSGTWAAKAGGQNVTVWLGEGQIIPPAAGSVAVWIYEVGDGGNGMAGTKTGRGADT
ncbi:hypothetical protein [Arthrobacter sp. OAP107]|uniref:hypothetical protein n=1 Tax=Arthrobacter sp. OAP107 TaxID=3156445 RepID=UPI003391C858